MKISKPSRPKLTVEFEPEELQALVEVLARIGGSRDDSDRKHLQPLYEELRKVGYDHTGNGIQGDLLFPDYES